MQTVLNLRNASKQYGDSRNIVKALNNVTFSITQGEFTGIMGASGSGKSTLLNVISTIDTVTDGSILIGNQDISDFSETGLANFRRDNLGFVFQDYNLLNTLTLGENISLALVIQKKKKDDIDDIVHHIAKEINIDSLLDKYPYEVSGGQRQRCACARAVATKPELLLADEPTGALDSASAKNLMETFEQLNQNLNVTILMVTHDAFSACFCRRILFMRDGEIVSELFKDSMNNQEFLGAILRELAKINGGDGYVC